MCVCVCVCVCVCARARVSSPCFPYTTNILNGAKAHFFQLCILTRMYCGGGGGGGERETHKLLVFNAQLRIG